MVPFVKVVVPVVPVPVIGVLLVNVTPVPGVKVLSGRKMPNGDVLLRVDIKDVTLLLNAVVSDPKFCANVELTLWIAAFTELNACVKKSLNVCV